MFTRAVRLKVDTRAWPFPLYLGPKNETLTDKEVNDIMERITAGLEEKFDASLRK